MGNFEYKMLRERREVIVQETYMSLLRQYIQRNNEKKKTQMNKQNVNVSKAFNDPYLVYCVRWMNWFMPGTQTISLFLYVHSKTWTILQFNQMQSITTPDDDDDGGDDVTID